MIKSVLLTFITISVVVSIVVYSRWLSACSVVASKVTAIINNGNPPSGFEEIIPGYCKREFALSSMIVNLQIALAALLAVLFKLAR